MTSAYVVDIHRQPHDLQAVLDAGVDADASRLLSDMTRFDRVVLTGMGASLHAMHPSFLRLSGHGLPVWNLETADMLAGAAPRLGPRSLLWVTSQSGESAEVLALLDQLGSDRPALLGSTSNLGSGLARAADAVVDLRAEGELTVSARSYVNTLAAHALVVDAVLGETADRELMHAAEAVSEYLAAWDSHVSAIEAELHHPTLFVLGRGASLAAARTGALISKEAAKTAVEAMSAPQFRHGPLELARDDVAVVLLAGSADVRAANLRSATDIRAAGAHVLVVDPSASGAGAAPALHGPRALPVAEILPLQAMSVALAHRRGVEPGAFSQISKVTTTL